MSSAKSIGRTRAVATRRRRRASEPQPAPAPLEYHEFRTGLTYADVYHLIYGRRWKRRRGVLGYWRELKQKLYAEYLRQFEEMGGSQPEYVPSDEPIPW